MQRKGTGKDLCKTPNRLQDDDDDEAGRLKSKRWWHISVQQCVPNIVGTNTQTQRKEHSTQIIQTTDNERARQNNKKADWQSVLIVVHCGTGADICIAIFLSYSSVFGHHFWRSVLGVHRKQTESI